MGTVSDAVARGTTAYTQSIREEWLEKRGTGGSYKLYILKAAVDNNKLGAGGLAKKAPSSAIARMSEKYRRISKGDYRGMTMFVLTLTERETCPTDCQRWSHCYGNNMPFAIRNKVNVEFWLKLEEDLQTLDALNKPYVLRLHILGDFPDVAYVRQWRLLLIKHPLLHIYGYTHWKPNTPVGDEVRKLNREYPDRFRIMASDGEAGDSLPRAIVVDRWEDVPPGIVACPQQTGKTKACATCGLCMNGKTEVAFIQHDKVRKSRGKSE